MSTFFGRSPPWKVTEHTRIIDPPSGTTRSELPPIFIVIIFVKSPEAGLIVNEDGLGESFKSCSSKYNVSDEKIYQPKLLSLPSTAKTIA